MVGLRDILAIGITIVVPAVVWTLLAIGLYEFLRDAFLRSSAHGRAVGDPRASQKAR